MKNIILILTLVLSFNIYSKVNVPVTSTSIAVDQISKYFSDSTYYKVRPNNVDGMVTEYLWDDYENENMITNKKIVYNQMEIAKGSEVLGILNSNVVANIINNDLKNEVYTIGNQVLKGENLNHAMNLIKYNVNNLINSGILFGFDGNHRNECGVVSDMLLVIDVRNSTIFGIDLNPCK